MKRISDEKVKAATGIAWEDWFSILDRWGARKKKHQEVATYLHEKYHVHPWWAQMVTVTYEKERGLRVTHERPDGYSISVSRTIRAPASILYDAWVDSKKRSRWLGRARRRTGLYLRPREPGGRAAHQARVRVEITTATPSKSIRAKWGKNDSRIAVNLYPKGPHKTSLTVQHSRLRSSMEGQVAKQYWSRALERLRDSVALGSGIRPPA